MKNPIFLTLLSALLFTHAIKGVPMDMSLEELPENLSSQTLALNHNYLVFKPENTSKEKLPLIIFLHGGGGGGIGEQILKYKRNPITGILSQSKTPSVGLVPQALKKAKDGGKGVWKARDLNLLLDHVKTTMTEIDHDRIYLTGTSMGGYGTWMWSSANPELFAATAPVCGGLGEQGPKDITDHLDQWKKNLQNLPIWAFHGAQDKVVPVERTKNMIESLKSVGSQNAKMTIYPDSGHNIGKEVYNNPELLPWLFSHKRNE